MTLIRRSNILLGIALFGTIGTVASCGTMLIATGELRASVQNSKEADAAMLTQIKINTGRLTSIETSNEKRAVIDSVFRADTKKQIEEVRGDIKETKEGIKDLRVRMSRMEFQHGKMPGSPSSNTPMKSFEDLSQTTLKQ